jgi:hypothetical protein
VRLRKLPASDWVAILAFLVTMAFGVLYLTGIFVRPFEGAYGGPRVIGGILIAYAMLAALTIPARRKRARKQ